MRRHRLAPAVLGLSLISVTACSADQNAADKPTDNATDGSSLVTRGPNGETPTPHDQVTLSDTQIEELNAGDFSAALAWPTSGPFIDAVNAGIEDVFGEVGIDVVATTDAGFDAAKQQTDVESAMALDPDVILSLPVDPTSAAVIFDPVVEAQTDIVFMSNVPAGYTAGNEYVSMATDDLAQMGQEAADLLAADLGDEGSIGLLTYDVPFYVTNARDEAFRAAIEKDHPGLEIVAANGFTDATKAEEVAAAMLTQNPDLDGLYVSWSGPAEGALSALRSAGNSDLRLVTMDLNESIALAMLEGDSVAGVVADEAYTLGRTLGTLAALGLLDETVPEFVTVPEVAVTADNVLEGWETSLNVPAPSTVQEAAQR